MKTYPELLKSTTNRRNFLRGAGICLLLPQMESLAGEKQMVNPTRMAFIQVPNGKVMNKWTPETTGRNFKMSPTLKPLESFSGDFSVFGGLEQLSAIPGGGGDHARAQGTFLTGTPILKAGDKYENGISVDQVAAHQIGDLTYLPSLELSSQRGQKSGSCDSGYSCAYQFTLSWAAPKKPMAPESSPALAFKRLFVDDSRKSKERLEALKHKKSILDYMLESSQSLKRKMGREDATRLDQYYNSVRELERKMEAGKPSLASVKNLRNFNKKPEDSNDNIEALMDLMALAWEVDATRICTMIIGTEGGGTHHRISHHGGNAEKISQLEKIDHRHVSHLAYFLQKLKERKFNGKPLLEQSMVLYGCGLSDGDKHSHKDLPIILAGQANGKLKPGEHKVFKPKPLCNLYVSMLNKMGVLADRFGDSDGTLNI